MARTTNIITEKPLLKREEALAELREAQDVGVTTELNIRTLWLIFRVQGLEPSEATRILDERDSIRNLGFLRTA